MKKVILLILTVAMIASMGVVSSFASVSYEDWPEQDAFEAVHETTKYSTAYGWDGNFECWFSSESSYLLHRIELKESADILAFGCGSMNPDGTDKINVSVYPYTGDLYESVDGEAIASETLDVYSSNWRTSIEFEETVEPGEYVVELSCPASSCMKFWFAASSYADGFEPEIHEAFAEGIAGGVDFVNYALSFRTYLKPAGEEETEAPSDVTPDPNVTADPNAATEAPTDEPTEAPTEEPTAAPTDEPTTAPTQAPTAAPTTAPVEESGCGSVVSGAAAIFALMGVAVAMLKKRG